MRVRETFTMLAMAGVLGCQGTTPDGPVVPVATPGVQVMMDFTRGGGFYAAPFPSEDLRTADGHVALPGFPNPANVGIVQQSLALVQADADGFAATAGVFFQLTAAPDVTRLPDLHGSLGAGSTVFLVGVDTEAPDQGQRYPVGVRYEDDGGPSGAPHMLVVLPQQGVPLRPNTLYAAVVLKALHDTTGAPLGRSATMAALAAGVQPPGLTASAWDGYRRAVSSLGHSGVAVGDIAGLAVFRTESPTTRLGTLLADALARPLPTVTAPLQRTDVFDGYCVYHSTLRMPVYQGGTPPYDTAGGAWVLDAMGHGVLQREEEANLVVTLPRAAMPASGFPTTVLIRTGAGGDRPLVDRGVQVVHNGPPLVAGTGPALYFARAGFAGVSVDGPLGGLRNTTHGDEQFLTFNVGNPAALRDNVRQSALELAILAHALDGITVDASDCPGLTASGPVRFDTHRLALMGHSMGSTIAPLVLGVEPRYGAAVLSGAGGSWIENVVYKLSPVAVRPVMEHLLHYSGIGRTLDEFDPALSLLQWAGEPADPPVYARAIIREPTGGHARHVLMVQGIVDTYILPSIANSTSLSLGLDLAGQELDGADPRLAMFAPLGGLLDLSGRHVIALPASGNVTVGGQASTDIVVQAPQDMVEDGHEVVFQTEGPKHQYQCFLQGFAAGVVPRVPAPDAVTAPCP